MKKKVLLKGPVLTRSGYGIHSRTILRALRVYEDYFDIYLENINWGKCGWISEDNEERHYIDSLILKTLQCKQQNAGQCLVDIFIHNTILNEAERKAPINIMVTAGIESNRISPQWVEKSQLVDKLIVVSQHAKYSFDNTSYDGKNEQTGEIIKNFKVQKPIEVIGYPVREFSPSPIDLDIKTNFNYLLDAQWGPRKNVEKTILAFIEENIDREDIGLVCKLNIAANSEVDKYYTEQRFQQLISKYPNRKCALYLLHGDLTDNQMVTLYTHPKIHALISLSNEGFGLSAFQAATYGLPIITMAFGGPCDFLYVPIKTQKGKTINKFMAAEVEFEIKPIPPEAVWDGVLIKDSQWAWFKEGSFKVQMRLVRAEYSKYKDMALKLQEHIKENFTEEKIYKQYAEAILGEKIVKVDTKDLPKVSIITSVFKSKDYLKQCLEDVEKQIMFKEKCEHILVHPKTSPDFEEEKKIILEYQEKNKENVKYIEVEKDGGLYDCWNIAIENSTGEYITNWNTDDRRKSDCIEKCTIELFLDKELSVVYHDLLITDKPNETFEVNSSNGKKYGFPEFSYQYQTMMNLTHATPMWLKSLHNRCGKFNPKYKSAGDWLFFLKCAYAGVKIKKMQEVLSLYYFNPTGISTNSENFEWKRKEEEEIYNMFKDAQPGDGKYNDEDLRQM